MDLLQTTTRRIETILTNIEGATTMPICKSCHKLFEMDDFLDSNIEESIYCPDCYYSGDQEISEEDMDDYDDLDCIDSGYDGCDTCLDDYDDENTYNNEVLSKMGDLEDSEFDEDELRSIEEQFDREEGDYEE